MLKNALISAAEYIKRFRRMQYINMCLSRGAANIALREIDPSNPTSWEFSAFSQNGEDGIIDYLTRKIINPDRYFIEIGAANGLENNTSWLALARRFGGLMVEGDTKAASEAKKVYPSLNLWVECVCQFVDTENIEEFKHLSLSQTPDVLSIDIDGNDYYVSKSLMEAGFRPKIFVVEYNSVFGPNRSCTIEYNPKFDWSEAHESRLYFGVSLAGWKCFFEKFGYKFITVDQNGVNAFFVNPSEFDEAFLNQMTTKLHFQDNIYQRHLFKRSWEKRLKIIEGMKLVEII